MSSWVVVLDGVAVAGGEDIPAAVSDAGIEVVGCFEAAPDGLGVPPLRTEDQTYPQRDGVRHFADWYEPRILTIPGVTIQSDGCADCISTRAMVKALMEAWSRKCDDLELVLFTDCHGETDESPGESPGDGVADRELVGPYGVRGRPRVASLVWDAAHRVATVTLRFDGADHRLYILDADGTPGSGQACEPLIMNYGVNVPYNSLFPPLVGSDTLHFPLDDSGAVTNPDGRRLAFASNSDVDDAGLYGNSDVLQQPALAPNLGPSTQFIVPPNPGEESNDFSNNYTSDISSVEVWWRPVSVPDDFFVWDVKGSSSDGSGIHIAAGGASGDLTWNNTLSGGSASFPLAPGVLTTLTDGNAHHVVVTQSGTALTLVIDGASSQVETLPSSYGIRLTISASLNLALSGRASNLALWDTAPSLADIEHRYDVATAGTPTSVDVAGNLCVPLEATFTGPLTNPVILSPEESTFIGVDRVIQDGESVVVDTARGTARLFPADASVLPDIVGDPFLTVPSGTSEVFAGTGDTDDTGSIELCWRPAVISG